MAKIKLELNKLVLSTGDVVVAKVPREAYQGRQHRLAAIRKELRKIIPEQFKVVVMDESFELQAQHLAKLLPRGYELTKIPVPECKVENR